MNLVMDLLDLFTIQRVFVSLVLILAIGTVWSRYRTHPLSYWQPYRRWSGGRWWHSSRGWHKDRRRSALDLTQADEEWREVP